MRRIKATAANPWGDRLPLSGGVGVLGSVLASVQEAVQRFQFAVQFTGFRCPGMYRG